MLKGAIVFAADLMRHVALPTTLETISARSYGNQLESTGVVTLVNALPDVRGKDVILVEDIIDTGLTLYTVIKALKEQEPTSIEIASFLIKPEMRKVELEVKWL